MIGEGQETAETKGQEVALVTIQEIAIRHRSEDATIAIETGTEAVREGTTDATIGTMNGDGTSVKTDAIATGTVTSEVVATVADVIGIATSAVVAEAAVEAKAVVAALSATATTKSDKTHALSRKRIGKTRVRIRPPPARTTVTETTTDGTDEAATVTEVDATRTIAGRGAEGVSAGIAAVGEATTMTRVEATTTTTTTTGTRRMTTSEPKPILPREGLARGTVVGLLRRMDLLQVGAIVPTTTTACTGAAVEASATEA